MISLRPLRDDDISSIKSWPPYPREFAMLDYSLRDGGWLDEYCRKDGIEILIAEENKETIGLSILSREPGGLAEFRIALHPNKLGLGHGKTISLLTMKHGFLDSHLQTIHLIVRKNNPRAQRLYESLRFRLLGECTEVIQGEPVAFYRMVIDRETFQGVDST
jgi:diamine N-acetyltransferase